MSEKARYLIASALLLALLCACGSRGRDLPAPELEGRWTQCSPADNFYQTAVISGDEIEVYWHIVADGSNYLYWAGSFEPPTDGREPYSWTSVNNLEKAKTDPHARREETLTFTYKDGKLHYVQIQGRIHLTVSLEREK